MQLARQLLTRPRMGMGWQSCIPFDTDNLTGEPIVQCNSVSSQIPCPAGVVEYPGEGYCPSTVYGYVPQLFERLVAGVGIEGLRGFRGVGDVMCPDGTNQPTINDCLDHGWSDPGIITNPASNPCGAGYKLDPTGGACIPVVSPQSITVTANVGTPGGCPTGFVMHPAGIAVCIPANSPAAQQTSTAAKPDWTKYALWGGGGLLLLMVVAMAAKR